MPTIVIFHLLFCCLLLASAIAITEFSRRLFRSVTAAPKLAIPAAKTNSLIPDATPSIAVVIPAYNEEINLRSCVEAVLQSQLKASQTLEVWIADDESSDRTGEIAQQLVREDPRVHLISVPPRPTDRVWRGKNWACTQAAEQVQSEYLLFIDADVRLEPQAIAAALHEAQTHQTDLLSIAPEIMCGCLTEWLVQPLMMSVLAVGFNFDAVNQADDPTAFAAGPFMLFRRASYEKIGGHRAVAEQMVEDVELGRLVKQNKLKLRYILGLGLVKVRMYQNFAALWEGWTKNYYMGANKNLGMTLYSAFVLSLVYVVPWLGLIWLVVSAQLSVISYRLLEINHQWVVNSYLALCCLTTIAIALQYVFRKRSVKSFGQPLRYWLLTGVGGAIVVAIALVSIIKTETGWGWTWRGRSLSTPKP
ncbi:glycosyltransferase family 2 protein [Tumidithrix elongata RA019]|uniref:Glycosyltransferase family 2 protein n=1 Tax=Tumidithrix elongata BACA0141 TaxID=2716417 RepID=A0AAW9Q670_9CYAN|nr:glycosyltransferase family 2 protein [Tumidithrix elongata RA019]